MKVKYNNQNISNTGSAHINTSLKTEQKKLKTKNRETRRKKKWNIRLEFSLNWDEGGNQNTIFCAALLVMQRGA